MLQFFLGSDQASLGKNRFPYQFKKYKSLLFIVVSLFLNHSIFAQSSGIYGTVKTELGENMPYTNVVILGQAVGTSTNYDGEYSLKLKPGTYKVSFQFIGYKSEVREISLKANKRIKLNPILSVEKVFLNAVEVSAKAENPAYEIIRNVQDKRQDHLNEHENISYKIYTKLFGKSETNGGSSIGLFGTSLTPHKGVFYLSESVNEVYQYDIANQTEKLEASLVLGDTSTVTENNTFFINLYQNRPFKIQNPLVTNRIISPIAEDAFGFYDYDYLGTFEESGESIHKIRIIPKMKGSTTFEGEIYIIDGSWRLLKSHLYLKTTLGDQEVNTQYIKDTEAETYLPFSSTIFIDKKSEKTEIYYYNIFYDYAFDKEAPDQSKSLNKVISSQGTKKDAQWWKETRPIALTEDEKSAYGRIKVMKKDVFKFDKTENDSLLYDIQGEQKDTFFQKYQKTMNSKKIGLKENLSMDLSFFTFNTVEGAVIKPHLRYNSEFKNNHKYSINTELRYGFASNSFFYKGGFEYELNPQNISRISISGGSTVDEILGNTSISNFWNAYYSLFFKENFLKLYQSDFIGIHWKREIVNGLDIAIESSFNQRSPLQNNSDYNWYDEEEEGALEYSPNQAYIQGEYQNFSANDLWKSDLTVSYQHNRKYDLINGRKIALSSKYPVLTVGYEVGTLDTEYSRFWGNISDLANLNAVGFSKISLSYGQYLNSNNLTPIDLFHFMGNRIPFNQSQKQYGLAFQLMNYYQFSVSGYFLGANLEHDFDGAILGRFPLLKKIGLKSYFMANYLQSAESPKYSELGFGLTSTFIPIRLNYFFSFENERLMRNGIQFHINF
jgi:hypothetical protein